MVGTPGGLVCSMRHYTEAGRERSKVGIKLLKKEKEDIQNMASQEAEKGHQTSHVCGTQVVVIWDARSRQALIHPLLELHNFSLLSNFHVSSGQAQAYFCPHSRLPGSCRALLHTPPFPDLREATFFRLKTQTRHSS